MQELKKELQKAIANVVKNQRKKSITKSADEIGMGKSLWADLENGIKDPQFSTLWRIAEGLDIVGGGTENHLMTLDLRKLNKTGKDIANVLELVGITANKNTVPNDPQSPFVTSGVRLGSPAVTTRGFKEEDMKEVGKIIAETVKISDTKDEAKIKELRERSLKLCEKYPLY